MMFIKIVCIVHYNISTYIFSYYMGLSWFRFTCQPDTPEHQQRHCLHYIGHRHVCDCWLIQPIMGNAILRQMGLSCIRKVVECKPRSKQLSRILPWSLIQFLP